ncbi:MAG TPA: hypothetical protein VGD65_04085 [Chryseosolibacter sp.]
MNQNTNVKRSQNIVVLLLCALPLIGFAQEEAITATGKKVILFPDSTWKLKPETFDSDTVLADSLTIKPKVERPKNYTDTLTGFKGFLKPEMKVLTLPEQSFGLYEFRVKVNKQGFVKEVITLKRGINGDAERMIRDAIARMKFLPDGSIVPPLTEGVVRVVVKD